MSPSAGADGEPLTLAHGARIEAWLRPLRARLGPTCLSEYAFANLYLFRHAHAYRFVDDDLPRITGVTYDGASHVLPLFDPVSVARNAWARLLRNGECAYPVATELRLAFDGQGWESSTLDADSDYLYPAANFLDYRGEPLRKKGNLMRQLLAAHQLETVPLDASRAGDARLVLDGWLRAKGKVVGEADHGPCGEALQHIEPFAFDACIYYADGIPVGFLIAEHLAPGVAVMRFAKGLDSHKGIYPYMFHEFCVSRTSTVDWLNFEQDLGLANFRQTKRSYHPLRRLAKYRSRVRTGR